MRETHGCEFVVEVGAFVLVYSLVLNGSRSRLGCVTVWSIAQRKAKTQRVIKILGRGRGLDASTTDRLAAIHKNVEGYCPTRMSQIL